MRTSRTSNPDPSGSSTALLWFTPGQGFLGRRNNMAIEDWCNWDVEEPDDGYGRPPSSFDCPCKWCGQEIVMFPWWAKTNRTETPSGWKPLNRDASNHICDARIKSQKEALVAQMPDLTLPECQFCHTPMKWLKGKPDFEELWSPHFFLSCSKCGATGPRVEHGHEEYEHLSKTVK